MALTVRSRAPGAGCRGGHWERSAMTEEKKPKIDLKARLGKASSASLPPALGSTDGGDSVPPPAASFPGPGAASTPALAPAAAPLPPPPVVQRFEVDDAEVIEARKSGFKQGATIAVVVGLAALGIGFAAGGASEKAAGRTKAMADMTDLATRAGEANAKLAGLRDKLDAGIKELQAKKFPESLASDLGGIHVDFDGAMLGGRRFSGVSLETTRELVDFATDVAAVNERKSVIATLLVKLREPIEKKFKGGERSMISYAVVLEGAGKGGPFFASLAPLAKGLEADAALPATYKVSGSKAQSDVPAYVKGDVSGRAIAVKAGTFEAACPDETKGAQAQLIAQLRGLAAKLKGEDPTSSPDAKAGLIERAEKLSTALKKSGSDS